MSLKRMGEMRCASLEVLMILPVCLDVVEVVLDLGKSRSGKRKLVSRKPPRWLVANCISTPSLLKAFQLMLIPALLNRTSNPRSCVMLFTSSAACRTLFRSERSSTTSWMCVADDGRWVLRDVVTAWMLASVREARIKMAGECAINACASAEPMLLGEMPVMRTTEY